MAFASLQIVLQILASLITRAIRKVRCPASASWPHGPWGERSDAAFTERTLAKDRSRAWDDRHVLACREMNSAGNLQDSSEKKKKKARDARVNR